MKNLKLILFIIAISFVIVYSPLADAQTFSLPERLSPYDVANWTLHSGFIASGTYEPTSVASDGQLYTNVATPTAPILWMSYAGAWQKVTSSFASGTVPHDALLNLDYDSSGHTGFAASTDIPNNASFTLAGLGEQSFSSLTDIPTSASYTLNGLSEKNWSSLDGKPTNASYTLAGLFEKSFDSLTDKPTSADYTLAGLGEKLWSSLDGAPTNASYTLLLLSEHSYNSLTDKPTSANWTLAGLSEKNFSSLANKPTTLAGYGITDAADGTILTNHIAQTVNPHGEEMTMGTGEGVGAVGYLASDTIFIERYFYIPFQAIATTFGINSSGMTFWADDNTKKMKLYDGSAWTKVITEDATGTTLLDVLKLAPRSLAPAVAEEGMIYQNSTDHHTYVYNGTTWVQLDN